MLREHYNDVAQEIMASHMENGEKMCDKDKTLNNYLWKNVIKWSHKPNNYYFI